MFFFSQSMPHNSGVPGTPDLAATREGVQLVDTIQCEHSYALVQRNVLAEHSYTLVQGNTPVSRETLTSPCRQYDCDTAIVDLQNSMANDMHAAGGDPQDLPENDSGAGELHMQLQIIKDEDVDEPLSPTSCTSEPMVDGLDRWVWYLDAILTKMFLLQCARHVFYSFYCSPLFALSNFCVVSFLI